MWKHRSNWKTDDLGARLASLTGGFARWTVLGGMVGLLAGTASAAFLRLLEAATELRLVHPWLLFLLPLSGAAVSLMYMKYGGSSGKGNNLILEQIHGGNDSIPLRMAPFVLAGTVLTHLFGGSAGREGTAVQMGGSLAEALGRALRIGTGDRRILLMCGISGGFGSVFGTPLAGTVFGLEVLAIGMIRHEALIPCFAASFVGHLVTTELWGVQHAHYGMGMIPALSGWGIAKVVGASVLFGLMSRVFSELTHGLKSGFARWIKHPAMRSAAGGFVLIGLTYAVGTRDYLGLGLPLLAQSFSETVAPLAFLWKTVFTTITLGAGFQGGEVTPLFVIGATLGNTLSGWLMLPSAFLAGLGLIAVFSGATNTPVACFMLGLELFGSEGAVYMFIACIVSYVFSGHSGIYTAQRIGVPKSRLLQGREGTALAALKERRAEADKQTSR
ncbi:voltage-gated chloride channel family protein [Paenibacillus filicis]|uniref:Voltage-gated chloride channel family protein n=1 Tax=Paenibacillus gyeongsangnamensis TaxID=3388067 RepID=A0ABT4Q841_9BACL|nr:voltage-gated chloride channel family protein [Paenibacillus filicis]MCZ8513034.1 voltage-gated chloride channel family protein [Paenibacillus filicis]